METEVTVRPAAAADVVSLVRLQRESPEASQWAAADYRAKLRHPTTLALVAGTGKQGQEVAGFLLAQVTADEMEILNFAVARPFRRRGLGRTLLTEGLRQGAGRGACRCFLEVRASNHAALLFYRGQGFAELYRRQNYYSDPVEDALICARELPSPERKTGPS